MLIMQYYKKYAIKNWQTCDHNLPAEVHFMAVSE